MSLFCQNFGQEHLTDVNICPRCGQRQPLQSYSDTAAVMRAASPEELHGVGGWLLIFCVSLAVISPIMQALIAAKAITNLATLRLPIQTLLRLGLTGAIYSGLAVFSCFAGVMLWMEKARAVSVAKAYLVVATVLPISLFLVPYLAGMHVNLVQIILTRSIYFAVWYSYLAASRRGKVTYGAP
jgi:Protein of unknown function (DUF2569)